MRILQEAEFRKSIKGMETVPGAHFYLFFGDEDYTKLADTNAVVQAVCPDPSVRMFNETRMDALNYTPEKLMDAVMMQPVMAEHRLVILSGIYLSAMKEEELRALLSVLSQLPDYDYTVFILSVPADGMDAGVMPTAASPRTEPRPSALLSRFAEYLTPVLFARNSPAQLASWVQRHFRSGGVQASPDFCREMVRYCGSDMFRLSSEIHKLTAYVRAAGREQATPEDLHTVAVEGTEFGAFDFSNAVMAGNTDAAFRVLEEMKVRRADPVVVFGEVSRIFCDALSVRLLSDRGLSADEIAASLKWKNAGRVAVVQRSTVRMPTERLLTAVRVCADADLTVKMGGKDYAALEQLLCSL